MLQENSDNNNLQWKILVSQQNLEVGEGRNKKAKESSVSPAAGEEGEEKKYSKGELVNMNAEWTKQKQEHNRHSKQIPRLVLKKFNKNYKPLY